ncbi:MAG: hypothetical protein KDK07_00010 [Bauldia sp.]|nr:hypothetical protein [Bauldia sp.]
MLGSEQTDHAIEACYDAVLDSVRWPDALQMLAESLGAVSCVIRTTDTRHPFRVDQRTRSANAPDSTGHREFTALWLEKIDGAPDPHFESHRWPSRGPVSFVVEDELTTAEERATRRPP